MRVGSRIIYMPLPFADGIGAAAPPAGCGSGGTRLMDAMEIIKAHKEARESTAKAGLEREFEDIVPLREGMYVFNEVEVGFCCDGESVFYATVDKSRSFKCERNNAACQLSNANEVIEQISDRAARRGVGEL